MRFSTKSQESKRPFQSRLRTALQDTKVQWGFIPAGLGIGFLGALQIYKVREREKRKQHEEGQSIKGQGYEGGEGKSPSKKQHIRPSGPW